MKLTVTFAWLLVAASAANASLPHAGRALGHARHARNVNARVEVIPNLAHRDQATPKRCKPRPTSIQSDAPASTSKPAAPAKTPEPEKTPAPAKSEDKPAKSEDKPEQSPTPTEHQEKPAVTTKAAAAAPPPPPKEKPAAAPQTGSSGNVLQLSFPQCGPNGATEEITSSAGPNGSEAFLDCGIEGAGWTPPPLKVKDVIAKDLSEALQDPNTPFKNCKPFVPLFEQYGNQFGVPPIFLASIAMQESSCNQDMTGGAGEQGLMQITKDKCGPAPNGDCKTPWFNIMTGAQFFAGLIDDNGGNVLKAVAKYNGWFDGITIGQATAAAHTSCCKCQNNLDYPMMFFNGWVLNRDPTASPRLGKYHNLDQCE